MAGRFKYDNKVFEVINAIVDLLVLGFFWIITSIPIFTMGASTTALYYTVNKSIRNKKGYFNQHAPIVSTIPHDVNSTRTIPSI